MNTNPTQFELDQENYRTQNGNLTTLPFMEWSTSQLVVVKHDLAEVVQVVEVETLKERTLSRQEFDALFGVCLIDEMVFYTANKDAIAETTRQIQSIEEAVKYCLYGKSH